MSQIENIPSKEKISRIKEVRDPDLEKYFNETVTSIDSDLKRIRGEK